MATLIVMTGVTVGTEFHLKPGVNRIGRSADNDCAVPDPSVSQHHCEVTRSETAVSVRDLHSTNGTYVDGKPVTDETPQPVEHFLQVGGVALKLHLDLNGEDAPIIHVPELPVEQPIRSGELPDGSRACANHPNAAASFRCSKCGQTLCDLCVRVIHRRGGMTLVFCSLCSASCQTVELNRGDGRQSKFLKWLSGILASFSRQ